MRGALASVTIGGVYAIVLGAGFVAPYDYSTQYRAFTLCPPTPIHFWDPRGGLHLRPFVYGLKPLPGFEHRYEIDRSAIHPVQILSAGAPYQILGGVVHARTHLFGVLPGAQIFLLGTDALGRDVFTRLLYGGQNSLFAGLIAAMLAAGSGLVMGGIAGYYGGWADEVIMRGAEVFLSVPWLYLLLTVRAFLPLRLTPFSVFIFLMSVSGLIGWGRPARLVRGVVLSAKHSEYVLAARGFGASDAYILRRHVLPQAYSVAITQASLYVPQYITAEVTLSFFGLGISEPQPSWGNMLADVRTLFVLQNCWWMLAPAVCLILVLFTFNWFFQSRFDRNQF